MVVLLESPNVLTRMVEPQMQFLTIEPRASGKPSRFDTYGEATYAVPPEVI